MPFTTINIIICALTIGNAFGKSPIPGRIWFPEEDVAVEVTTQSPAVQNRLKGQIIFDLSDFLLLYNTTSFQPLESDAQNKTHTVDEFDKNFNKFKVEIDQLRSIDDFANYFNMSLPEDPFIQPQPISTGIHLRSGLPTLDAGSIPTVLELDQANCELESTTVSLDLPIEKGVTFFPTCVRVQRCGGCCYLAHHSCQPTEIETIGVKVMRVQQQVTRARRRIVRNADANYMEVEVAHHRACDCKCKLMATDCIPDIHSYNEHQCACVCKNKDAELKCVASNKHFWNNNKCRCLCRNEMECSTGQAFDHESCSCVNIETNSV